MKNYGLTSVAEFVGDRIVYRNLDAVDERLPRLADIRAEAGIPDNAIPRKSEPGYARVIVHLLRLARALDVPVPIKRLIFVGDTRMNDGTAFVNICRAGDWPGLAFIGAEKPAPPHAEMTTLEGYPLYLANRWTLLAEFDTFCGQQGFPVDESTAVVLDLDKTTLGARGRNDHVIDAARVAAVKRTVGDLLGTAFDAARFQMAYDQLNQPEFHPFTADNQDYLAYICLIIGSGLYEREALMADVRAGRMPDFVSFIRAVDVRAAELPDNLRMLHADIYARVQAGDPTPFKAFRYNEYRETVGRMGTLPADAAPEDLLAREICITHEVRELMLAWRERGALLFALSDKPDEASLPSDELQAAGYAPIHRTLTHGVGASC
ncbi:MAG TPA: hypothetical protein PLJ78_08475 [Anaerolineae bacterium]|nr:hypothetical protein [Anaerolineae bacterium]HQK13961.1 hypothetical protein [Anaerolineae bacterium]